MPIVTAEKENPNKVEQEAGAKKPGEKAAQAALARKEDDRKAASIERAINRRLVKIQRDQDQMLSLSLRIERYRREIRALGRKHAEVLTLRLEL